MKKVLDPEYVKTLCFPYRDYESSDLVELLEEDMKYKPGDIFYLKQPEEILKNPSVTEAQFDEENNGLKIEIAADASTILKLDYWNHPKVIEAPLLYTEAGITQWYYTFKPLEGESDDKGWVEEWIIMEKPNKKLQALSVIKHLGGFSV